MIKKRIAIPIDVIRAANKAHDAAYSRTLEARRGIRCNPSIALSSLPRASVKDQTDLLMKFVTGAAARLTMPSSTCSTRSSAFRIGSETHPRRAYNLIMVKGDAGSIPEATNETNLLARKNDTMKLSPAALANLTQDQFAAYLEANKTQTAVTAMPEGTQPGDVFYLGAETKLGGKTYRVDEPLAFVRQFPKARSRAFFQTDAGEVLYLRWNTLVADEAPPSSAIEAEGTEVADEEAPASEQPAPTSR